MILIQIESGFTVSLAFSLRRMIDLENDILPVYSRSQPLLS